jgi:thymidylate kinase
VTHAVIQARGTTDAGGSPRHFILELFRLLDTHLVRYAVLHSYDALPDTAPSDIDMAVDGEDVPKLDAVLCGLATAGYLPLQSIEYESGSCYYIFGWFESQCLRTVAIDFTSEHREGHTILMSGRALVERRRRTAGFWIPAPDVEFQYLLAKKVLKGSVSARQGRRLRELALTLGPNEATRIAGRLFGSRRASEAISVCTGGDLAAALPELRRRLRRSILRRDPLHDLRYFLSDLPRKLRRVARPSGVFVTVMGPDGAGKSTLISAMMEDAGAAFRSTRVMHWRPRVLFGAHGSGTTDNPHGSPDYSCAWSVLRAFAHTMDYFVGHWLRVWPALVQSGLVIFDRYYDDMLADPRRYRYGGPTWLLRALRRGVKAPDLLIVLDASPEVVRARKQEQTTDEIRRQREQYRSLALEHSNAVLIDAGRSASEVRAGAIDMLARWLVLRFNRRHPVWAARARCSGGSFGARPRTVHAAASIRRATRKHIRESAFPYGAALAAANSWRAPGSGCFPDLPAAPVARPAGEAAGGIRVRPGAKTARVVAGLLRVRPAARTRPPLLGAYGRTTPSAWVLGRRSQPLPKADRAMRAAKRRTARLLQGPADRGSWKTPAS